jgi:hypothetical protein
VVINKESCKLCGGSVQRVVTECFLVALCLTCHRAGHARRFSTRDFFMYMRLAPSLFKMSKLSAPSRFSGALFITLILVCPGRLPVPPSRPRTHPHRSQLFFERGSFPQCNRRSSSS